MLIEKQATIGKINGNFCLKSNETKEYEHIAVNLIENNDFRYKFVEI